MRVTNICTTCIMPEWPPTDPQWVEVCFCATPLEEERPYWEQYFEFLSVKDAHARKNCRDLNGSEPWACCNCDCTRPLEERLARSGQPFLETISSTTQGK